MMSSGIYAYWDNIKNYYVYVGQDHKINSKNNRNYNHMLSSRYDDQPINRILQNNIKRYEYRIIMEGDYNDWQLNQMEKLCIKSFKTYKYDYPERNVFNFTKGGDGVSGWKHSKKTKKKMSEINIGSKNPNYGNPTKYTHSKKIKTEISVLMTKYKIWDATIVHYVKSDMFKGNGGNKPRKVFRLRFKDKDIPIGGFVDFVTPKIIHDLICEAIEDYNE